MVNNFTELTKILGVVIWLKKFKFKVTYILGFTWYYTHFLKIGFVVAIYYIYIRYRLTTSHHELSQCKILLFWIFVCMIFFITNFEGKNSVIICVAKRYFIIDQQKARNFVHCSEWLSNPPFLLCISNT